MSREKRTIVIKIGSSCIVQENGSVSLRNLAELAQVIGKLSKLWERVVLVSSGAIVLGRHQLGTRIVPQSIPEKQALASVGQLCLMNLYKGFLDHLGVTIGQILVSKADFGDPIRNENTLNTFENLFNLDVVPIVNENDTVAVEEIKYGDNDELAALVAGFLNAEWLFILTNHDGVFRFSEDESGSQMISLIETFDFLEELYSSIKPYEKHANLKSKLKAAEIAAHRKVKTVITNGCSPTNILDIVSGQEIGTKIAIRNAQYLHLKEYRMRYALEPVGKIYINAGAAKAILERKASLLPVGIMRVEEDFPEQSMVAVYDESEHRIARGITIYSSTMIKSMKGMKKEELPSVFGEVIHRNYMVFD